MPAVSQNWPNWLALLCIVVLLKGYWRSSTEAGA